MAEVAVKYGLDKNYFFVVRKSTPDKFKAIQAFDEDNLNSAYDKYLTDTHRVKEEMINIYYWVIENSTVADYGQYLVEKKLYRNKNSFATETPTAIFNSCFRIRSHATYLKYMKTIEYFEEYKERITEVEVV